MSQASVSRIISQVTDILYNKARTEIKMPQNPQEIHQTAQAFHRISGFPRVIGAIDGTHIPIKAPSDNEYIYVNRKGYHSLNLQVVGNAQNLITSYTVKYPGSTHDAYIWNNCPLRGRFQDGVYGDMHLLGDSGYPLEPFLLTPYPHPTTRGQERYNRSHKKTRTIIEQTFGVLKSRFRCLHNSGGSLQYEPKKCAKIAVACMPAPELLEEEEQEDDGREIMMIQQQLQGKVQAAKLYPPLSDTRPLSSPKESFSDDDIDDDNVDESQQFCSGYKPSKRLCPSN
ncbi:putative nuclease HARBI1 [Macrobrachium nipponense]|uniref:putative nuclease HARBI1 n=1 Tax=Macrobrachium nipponense TaxID=159736 RepID=UPI0030C7F9B9